MRLERLEYFVAVADEGHVGRAARRLHISQPALSQQVRKLEEHVGTPLLLRTGRTIELTDAGRLLARRARRIVADVDRAEQAVRDLGAGRSGTVRVAFSRSTEDDRIRSMVDTFAAEHAGVTVETSSGWTSLNLEHLLAGRLDVAFLRGPVDEERVRVVPVDAREVVVVLPSGHRLAARSSVPASELRRTPFVYWPRDQAPAAHDDVLARVWPSGPPSERVDEPDGDQIIRAVEAGRGFTLMDVVRVQRYADRRVAVRPLARRRVTSSVVVAVTDPPANPLASHFVEHCRRLADPASDL